MLIAANKLSAGTESGTSQRIWLVINFFVSSCFLFTFFSVPTDTGKIAIARVPNTNKHSTEGSNPIWLQAYENEWYKNDDSYSQGSSSHDSLDENVLVSEFEKTVSTSKEFNGLHTQNNLIKHLNMYQHIDKLTNGTIIAKKLETTEL